MYRTPPNTYTDRELLGILMDDVQLRALYPFADEVLKRFERLLDEHPERLKGRIAELEDDNDELRAALRRVDERVEDLNRSISALLEGD